MWYLCTFYYVRSWLFPLYSTLVPTAPRETFVSSATWDFWLFQLRGTYNCFSYVGPVTLVGYFYYIRPLSLLIRETFVSSTMWDFCFFQYARLLSFPLCETFVSSDTQDFCLFRYVGLLSSQLLISNIWNLVSFILHKTLLPQLVVFTT